MNLPDNLTIDPDGIYFVVRDKPQPIEGAQGQRYIGRALLTEISQCNPFLDNSEIYEAKRLGSYHIIKQAKFEPVQNGAKND